MSKALSSPYERVEPIVYIAIGLILILTIWLMTRL